jgi:hypothetical protein
MGISQSNFGEKVNKKMENNLNQFQKRENEQT